MRNFFFITIAIFAAASPAFAQLVFEEPEQTFTAELNQTSLTADYAFSNKGKKAIKIIHITTSCGCTTTTLEKKTYQPGESGTISAELKFGSNAGTHTKYIFVKTDETKEGKMYKLTIGAIVPELMQIKPAYLKWAHAEKPATKTVEIKVVYKEPIKITQVKNSSKSWTVQLETIEEGRQYRLSITPPKDTTQVSRTVIKLVSDLDPKDPREFRVTARIARKREKPKTNWLRELLR